MPDRAKELIAEARRRWILAVDRYGEEVVEEQIPELQIAHDLAVELERALEAKATWQQHCHIVTGQREKALERVRELEYESSR